MTEQSVYSGRPRVHVAVGVVVDERDEILVSYRLAHLHQGGLWEFPGGKVEPGESVRAALARELLEELAIEVVEAEPLTAITHDYTDKSVLLDVWWVSSFRGAPQGREGQRWQWVGLDALAELEFPAANRPIIEAIRARLAKP